MSTVQEIERRLQPVFTSDQSALLATVISDSYNALVKTSDFNELKEIVRDLGQAQARTEVAMKELSQAQARTEVTMKELSQAQARTEVSMKELSQA